MKAVLEINPRFRLLRSELPNSWIVQEVDSAAATGGGVVKHYFTRTMPMQAAGIASWMRSHRLPNEAVTHIESLL